MAASSRSTPNAAGATPAMAQWFAAKEAHPDALVFFRMGDFYELFFSDAEAAAAALDIALTQRGEHNGAPVPMCGVPQHAAEAYLARLIRRGFRVAVTEQMEDPKSRTGKAPIRREVVRLVTPGTITEEALLEAGRANLLLGLAQTRDEIGAAWLDVSTGLFETMVLRAGELPALLGRLEPVEILAPDELALGDWATKRAPDVALSPPLVARRRLAETFGVASLDAFGGFTDAEAIAALMAIDYVRATQAGTLPRLAHPVPQGNAGLLAMDAATRSSLEIHRARDGGGMHSLLGAVQRTLTPAGARLLASWLAAPLTDPAAVAARQDAWGWLLTERAAAEGLRAALRSAPDIARALGRLSVGRGGPRDLAAVRDGLRAAGAASSSVMAGVDPASHSSPKDAGSLPALLRTAVGALSLDASLEQTLSDALAEPAPHRLDDGNAVRPGFDPELDAERSLRDDSRRVLATLQLDYAQRYGVASLKIKHHAQLGYVIEAPAAAVEKLRDQPELTLRQGMANGARFTTPELSDLDRRISEAGERAAARERVVFASLVQTTLAQADALAACADALAVLDAVQSAAKLAEPGTWCRPSVTDDDAFLVNGGRHPVVEAALAGHAQFVPNDCDLSPEQRVLLLTGPNMAGKSTFLRQNALIVVLAQAGLPVPAESASIGVVDRLFSRVGAADDLARGRSTFMVEMTETAAILHQAGPRSLVVVDEIGRGTATLDGLAIAWAVLESLHSAIRCRTIFATHFHELAELAERLPRIKPHTMRVKEWKGTVVFLHEVAAGAAGRSWGVHVAELAGVPAPVVRRAASLLATFEKQRGPANAPLTALPLFAAAPSPPPEDAPSPGADALAEAIAALEPDRMTPRDALDALYRLKAMLAVCGAAAN
ncbi:MAG TPA: DNA mismatch repair protein MutS [Acetobacteraceae bacterium]|nr:DNA mismatch repair protein MutS [Acetobacteraceae bacterium]